MSYDEKLCDEKHKNIKDVLDDHEKRLNGHSKRIDDLEKDGVEYKSDIKHLCEEVSGLVTTMKWFMGIWVTSLLGFFFYAVQKIVFK
jgi:hypothetical protein